MSRAQVIIKRDADRERAAKWAHQVPYGTRIEFKETKRSIPQNDKMWACLTDIARQMTWHGHKLTPKEWKWLFLDALDRETKTVPSLNGEGLVTLGRSSSDLSKNEMSDLIELIYKFAAEHEIELLNEVDA